jgi:hypothetical protein
MTPDNASYYHAAYIAAAVIIGGYLFSLWRRGRQLRGRR